MQTQSGPGWCMHTKPGPDQDGAMAMENHPGMPGTTPSDDGDLQLRFGDRWQIEQPALGIWSATHRSRDGRHVRVIIAHGPEELAGNSRSPKRAQHAE